MSRLAERASTKINDLVKNLTGDEIVEIGIGLIGRGVFRAKERDGEKSAIALVSAASSTLTSIHIDMRRATGIFD